ncbi:MAG: hypothetical protein AB1666_04710, partial [Pseudomonadota bacterium]
STVREASIPWKRISNRCFILEPPHRRHHPDVATVCKSVVGGTVEWAVRRRRGGIEPDVGRAPCVAKTCPEREDAVQVHMRTCDSSIRRRLAL